MIIAKNKRKVKFVYRNKYYVCYISYNAAKIEESYGIEKADAFQKSIAKILNRTTTEYEFCARIDNGVFG